MLEKAHAAHEAYKRDGLLTTLEFVEELSLLSGHPSPAHSASSRATSPRSLRPTDRTPRQGETDLRYSPPQQPPPTMGGAWVSRPQSAPVVASPPQNQGVIPGSQPLPGGFRLGGSQLQQAFVDLAGGSNAHYAQAGPSYQAPIPQYQPQVPQYQPQASPAFAPVNIAASRLGEERIMALPRSNSNPQYSSGPPGFHQQLPLHSIHQGYQQTNREYGAPHQAYPLPDRTSSSTLEGGLASEPQWGWQPAYPSAVPRRNPTQP